VASVLTVIALASFVAVAAPAASALTSAERQHLVAHLEMTAAWLADEVADLTPAQLSFRREPGAWTISEVVEHLVLVAPIYWQDLQAALKQPAGDRRSAMTDADVLWYGIDRTSREQAIPGERTAARPRDAHAVMEAYRTHHDRLLRYVRTTDDDLRSHIVPRQQCDGYQWALLISAHEQRHVLQIREIKADPKFPKK
jgi:5-methylcytosine-specific restriction endonuclease McrA